MNVHKNAPMTVRGRLLMVWGARGGLAGARRRGGVSERAAHLWLAPHRECAWPAARGDHRRDRAPAPATLDRPAHRALGRSVPIVGSVRRPLWLGRLAALEAKPAAVRYERGAAGELLHLDGKKLRRIGGFGHHVIGDRAAAGHAGSTGGTCTSRSTTLHALPTPSCCTTRAARPAPASSPAPPRGSPASAPGSSGS
jgi:hypothetical protein